MELILHVHAIVDSLIANKRQSTAKNYRSALTRVTAFYGRGVTFEEFFIPDKLMEYQNHLRHNGLKWNTIANNMRVLRAIYNKGCSAGMGRKNPDLFNDVFKGNCEGRICALNKEDVVKIVDLDLSRCKGLQFVRDLFLLSYYLHGMAFVDMAHLLKTDLSNGFVRYCRQKSKSSYIQTPVGRCALDIINRYTQKNTNNNYLLPIIKDPLPDTYRQYESALRSYNRKLKAVGKMAGVEIPLTSYVARHTWATIAHELGGDISVIAIALGHKNETMTRNYVERLNYDKVTKLNAVMENVIEGTREMMKKVSGS